MGCLSVIFMQKMFKTVKSKTYLVRIYWRLHMMMKMMVCWIILGNLKEVSASKDLIPPVVMNKMIYRVNNSTKIEICLSFKWILKNHMLILKRKKKEYKRIIWSKLFCKWLAKIKKWKFRISLKTPGLHQKKLCHLL